MRQSSSFPTMQLSESLAPVSQETLLSATARLGLLHAAGLSHAAWPEAKAKLAKTAHLAAIENVWCTVSIRINKHILYTYIL